MFSFKGTIVSGNDEKKNTIVRISKEDYEKIVQETGNVLHVFADPQSQPIMPAWQYHDGYYAKILLSKARKDQYQTLMDLVGENLFSVKLVPYSFNNSNTGICNGFSLYWQGAFTVPKKFVKKQTPQESQAL
jgi:hypothetical protein